MKSLWNYLRMSDCECDFSDCDCDCGSCNDCCGDDQDCCGCCNDDTGNDQTNVEGQRGDNQGCWFCVIMTDEDCDCCDNERRRRRRYEQRRQNEAQNCQLQRYEQNDQNEAQNGQPDMQTTQTDPNNQPVISTQPPSYDEATSDAVTSQPV